VYVGRPYLLIRVCRGTIKITPIPLYVNTFELKVHLTVPLIQKKKKDFVLPPAGNRKDLVKYHEDLKILPLHHDTIHLITGWSHHKFESDVPLPS
jgi:hypothetical protein